MERVGSILAPPGRRREAAHHPRWLHRDGRSRRHGRLRERLRHPKDRTASKRVRRHRPPATPNDGTRGDQERDDQQDQPHPPGKAARRDPRRHQPTRRERITTTLRLPPGTEWTTASTLLRTLPRSDGGAGIPTAADIAAGAYAGARHLTPKLLSDLLGDANVSIPQKTTEYLRGWEERTGEVSTPYGPEPKEGEQRRINTAEVKLRREELTTIASNDTRLDAHLRSIRADPAGCVGFMYDYASWQEGRHSRYHYPNDDIHHAFRIAAARLRAIPIVRGGTTCAGCTGDLDEHADHGLSCNRGTRYCMGSWKTKRHDACTGIIYRLGVAAGLRPGDHIQTEVRDLYSAKRPSDILVWRPRSERAAGEETAFRFNHDAGGLGPSNSLHHGVHHTNNNFRDTSYDITIAATQAVNQGQFGFYTAAHGSGTMMKKPEATKRNAHDNMIATTPPEANRRARFQVLGFESSGCTSTPAPP